MVHVKLGRAGDVVAANETGIQGDGGRHMGQDGGSSVALWLCCSLE